MDKKAIITSKIFRFWFPVAIWAAVIFVLSAKPLPTTSEFYWKDFVVKKTAHLIEYAVFGTLVFRALINSGVSRKKAAIWSILISILYSLSDEFHQSFTPGREPRIRDVIFDTIGAGLAVYALWKLLAKAPKRLRSWAEKLQLT